MLYLMKFQKFLQQHMKIKIRPQIYLTMNLLILNMSIYNNKNKINKITTNQKILNQEEIHLVNLLLENYFNNQKKKQKMISAKMIQTLIIIIK